MSVRCARCPGADLELVRIDRTETREHGLVEIEHWRCPSCRGGGHRALEPGADRVVNVAGPVLDYAPRTAVGDR